MLKGGAGNPASTAASLFSSAVLLKKEAGGILNALVAGAKKAAQSTLSYVALLPTKGTVKRREGPPAPKVSSVPPTVKQKMLNA